MIHRSHIVFLSFFGLFFSLQGRSSSNLENKHREIFHKTSSIKVNFKQILYKSLRGRKIRRKGVAYFSKPNKFRWDFQSEILGNEEFYYNGEQLTHFRENEKLVTRYTANVGLAKELNQVVNLLLDPQKLLRRYEIKSQTKQGKSVRLMLVPKEIKASEILSITAVISDQKKYIETVKIDYVNKNYTQFTFNNPIFKSISPKIFNFSRKGKFTILDQG